MSNKNEILNESIDIVQQLGEVGIDLMINDNILKEIPVLGTIVGLAKVKCAISDMLLLEKIKKFIDNTGDVTAEDKQKFNEKMNNAEAFAKISKAILHYINNYDTEEKAALLGFVFHKLLKGEISESIFKKIASLVGSITIDELRVFVLRNKTDWNWDNSQDYISQRLISFRVPTVQSVTSLGNTGVVVDQMGMISNINIWGETVVNILLPYFKRK